MKFGWTILLTLLLNHTARAEEPTTSAATSTAPAIAPSTAPITEAPAPPAPALTPAAVPTPEEGSAQPQFTWAGDLRLRAQAEKNGDNETRWSGKIRVRFGVAVQINPELRTEIRVAAAKSNRSTNQTLGDGSEPGARRRFIGLDQAFVEWQPLTQVKLYGGRIPQIHYRPGGSQVLLDEDIALEGAALSGEYHITSQWRVFINGGSVYIRENYVGDPYYIEDSDNMINWGQTGLGWKMERWKVTAGTGFFNFTSMQGRNFADLVVGGAPGGNSERTTGVVKNPYLPRQYFIETAMPLGPLDAGLFAERVVNPETKDPHSAWWLGATLGQKSWDAQFAYGEVQSDAVPAMFTYSDFGNGTTDVRGVVIAGRWKFAKNMSFKLTQFINRISASQTNKEYNRTHLDINASF